MIYLDNAATTRIDNKVLNDMIPFLDSKYGNMSSLYSIGYDSKMAYQKSLMKISGLLNCDPSHLIFTSGGSEGDNMVIKGFVEKYEHECHEMPPVIITTSFEHHAILNSCRQVSNKAKVIYLKPNRNGIITTESLKEQLEQFKDYTVLVSIMYVNNEIGTIQNIKELCELTHKYGKLFHTDAVQAVGHVKIDIKELDVDYLTISGHKFYAPKGIGIQYIKDFSTVMPLINGGKQQNGLRGGTEPIYSIVALGSAASLVEKEFEYNKKLLEELTNYFLELLTSSKICYTLNVDRKYCIDSTLSIYFSEIPGDILQRELSVHDICVSTGSACTAGVAKHSHVLLGIGLSDDEALHTVRFSFGKYNTKKEIDIVIETIKSIIDRYKKFIDG